MAILLFAGVSSGPHVAFGAGGGCAQPVSTGANPVASDCLFILRVAVAIEACTPQACVCDPTGDANVTASDALTCLKKAVGEAIALLCRCDGVPTTTTTAPTTTIPDNGADCTDDGNCRNDDCVCSDCAGDLFCSDPTQCKDDGMCNTFTEGCVCTDCMMHPECLDN